MSKTTAQENTNISWLKPGQVEELRDAAHEGRHGLRDDAILTMLYDTGLRRGELSSVDRAMLDVDDQELRVPTRIQKDYPTSESPPPATFELDPTGSLGTTRTLRAYLNDTDTTDALFPSQKSDRLTGKAINDVVKRAARRGDVRPHTYDGHGDAESVTAHTLRHSVAYRMLRVEDGNTLYDVRNRLRHSSILTTEQNYDHFDVI